MVRKNVVCFDGLQVCFKRGLYVSLYFAILTSVVFGKLLDTCSVLLVSMSSRFETCE